MTQKVRWLAALALLLAFSAGSARAEDEDDQVGPAAPTRLTAELLPAPRVVFTPPVSAAPQRPLLFAVPTPFPCPMPVPVSVYGLCPDCPACAACPCPTGTCVCPTCACGPMPHEPPQYVVEMKLVKGGDAETAQVTACPRVSVMAGQTANVLLQGVDTPAGHSSLQMQVTVGKQGNAALLDMAVTESMAHVAAGAARSHTETTEEHCNVPFGKPYKMQLKNDGDDRRLEVTVTEVEREERMPHTACPGTCPVKQAVAEESDACPMDAVGEIVDCLYDIVSDAATSAVAWALDSNDDEELAPTYLQHPPQYVPPSPPLPVARVVSVEAAPACPACTAASCPKAKSGCVQCAATEAVKKLNLHIHIDAVNGRKSFDLYDGDSHWKGSADRVTVRDGYMILEGGIHMATSDGSKELTMEKVHLKVENMEIQIGD